MTRIIMTRYWDCDSKAYSWICSSKKEGGGQITFVWEVPREVRDFLTQLQHNSALKVVVVGGQTILCSGGSSGGGL